MGCRADQLNKFVEDFLADNVSHFTMPSPSIYTTGMRGRASWKIDNALHLFQSDFADRDRSRMTLPIVNPVLSLSINI